MSGFSWTAFQTVSTPQWPLVNSIFTPEYSASPPMTEPYLRGEIQRTSNDEIGNESMKHGAITLAFAV